MHDILQHLRDPVRRKRDKHHQSNHLRGGAPPRRRAAGRIIPRLVLGIDGDQRDAEPGPERGGDQASNQAHDEDMAVVLRHVDRDLEHQHREGNPRDPGDEADDVEDGEDEEDDGGAVLVPREVDGCCADPEHDLEDARDPDDLFGEGADHPEVDEGEDECHGEDEGEQNNRVRTQSHRAGATVDATSLEKLRRAVALDRNPAHDHEAGECSEEEKGRPDVVVFWALDGEGLVEVLLLRGGAVHGGAVGRRSGGRVVGWWGLRRGGVLLLLRWGRGILLLGWRGRVGRLVLLRRRCAVGWLVLSWWRTVGCLIAALSLCVWCLLCWYVARLLAFIEVGVGGAAVLVIGIRHRVGLKL